MMIVELDGVKDLLKDDFKYLKLTKGWTKYDQTTLDVHEMVK